MRSFTNINHLAVLVAVFSTVMMVSCFKDEVVCKPGVQIESQTICFDAEAQWMDEGNATRGGAMRNRVGMLTVSSADGSHSLPVGIYEQEGIHTAECAETRGSKLDGGSSITSFMAWASMTGVSETSLLFPAEGVEFSKNANNIFESDPQYFWPGAGTIDFVAIANAPASGITPNLNSSGTAVESFTYTVPTAAADQKDIVVATALDVDGGLNASVPLTFKHVMTAVQVRIGSMPSTGGTIKSMKFKNIYNSGTYDYVTDTWSRAGTKSDYPVLSNGDASYTPGSTGSFVNGGEYTLMMLPQTLADDAVLEIVFQYSGASEVTLTASIAKNEDGVYYEWKKNNTTYYTISIDENYNLQVIPQGNVLDAHYIMTTANINVSKIDTGQKWYLKVSADNVTSSEDISVKINDGSINQYIKDGYWINAIDGNVENARGSKKVTGSGTGVTNVIIFIPENITARDRRITLEYGIEGQEANAKYEYLYQKAPFWDSANNWGWEKVDDQNSGTYGFEWTRKACYMFAYKIGGLHNWTIYDENYIRGIIEPLIEQFNAEAYVSIDTFTHYEWKRQGTVIHYGDYAWRENGQRIAVIIDYTKLTMDNAASQDDGWSNTKAFFDARNIVAFEDALKAVTKVGEYNDDGTLQTAFRMLETYLPGNGATTSESTCGKFEFDTYEYTDPTTGEKTKKMFREFGELDDASGILKYVIMRNAYDIVSYSMDENNSTFILDMNSERIKWYLPAVNQFVNLENFEFATGDATFTAADFWSSTAAPNNQAYIGSGDAISRHDRRKVIVQRYVPGGPAAVTIDNTSMQGGDNGEAQWVE